MNMGQKWWWLSLALICGFLLYLLGPILTPFAIGAVLAYFCDPLVDRLERLRLPRTLAVVVVFIVILLVVLILVLLLIPMLQRQWELLVSQGPQITAWIKQTAIPWLTLNLGLEPGELNFSLIEETITSHWKDAGSLATRILASVTSSGLAIFAWLANLVLIPVVTFYLLRDWDLMIAKIAELLPRKIEPTVSRLARDSDEVIGAFLRGQFIVMVCLGVIYTIGLYLVGLDLALIIGVIAGLASIVPYLGFAVGIVIAAVAALVQFHEPMALLWVGLVFTVGQMLEGMVLTPWLVGDKIGLHPVAVIFAVLAGGQLFGFFGVLLALPVAAVIVVLVRYAHDHYRESTAYKTPPGNASVLLEPDRRNP